MITRFDNRFVRARVSCAQRERTESEKAVKADTKHNDRSTVVVFEDSLATGKKSKESKTDDGIDSPKVDKVEIVRQTNQINTVLDV